MRTSNLSIVLGASVLGLFGCGQSDEQRVMEYVRNRKKPGMYRFVNLSNKVINGRLDDRTLGPIAPGTACRFELAPPGKRTFVVQSNGKDAASLEVDLKQQQQISIV